MAMAGPAQGTPLSVFNQGLAIDKGLAVGRVVEDQTGDAFPHRRSTAAGERFNKAAATAPPLGDAALIPITMITASAGFIGITAGPINEDHVGTVISDGPVMAQVTAAVVSGDDLEVGAGGLLTTGAGVNVATALEDAKFEIIEERDFEPGTPPTPRSYALVMVTRPTL